MTWLTSEESINRFRDASVRATNDINVFNNFRQESGIREIIEGIPDIVGHGYYSKLKTTEFFKKNWTKIIANDQIGNPKQILVDEGQTASTTMRYAWNVYDMQQHNVALDNVDIVEIGGGYGGLCRMIHAFHNPKSYTIIDIPEVLSLAKKYLVCYDITPKMMHSDSYKIDNIDTFISNYALTELTQNIQKKYVDNLLSRASSGYLTYNSQPRNITEQYSLDQFQQCISKDSTSIIVEENIKRSECKVLIWHI